MSKTIKQAGYIGLGVMGEPMCQHLASKRQQLGLDAVFAFDLQPEPLQRLQPQGATPCKTIRELVEQSDLVMFCLPGGPQVEKLLGNPDADADYDGLLRAVRPGQIILDMGTTPVGLTRETAQRFAERGVRFADSPVTRTRQAAIDGTLSTLVGGSADLFEEVRPYIEAFSAEVTHCGPVGAGQIIKQMNNMVLFQTVVAIAEALATSRAAGIDDQVLVNAMSKGSGDSFALRNHGVKAMLPGDFPERAFSTRYAMKDLDYAIELAEQSGLSLSGAQNTRSMFRQAIANGDGDRYFPVLINALLKAQK